MSGGARRPRRGPQGGPRRGRGKGRRRSRRRAARSRPCSAPQSRRRSACAQGSAPGTSTWPRCGAWSTRGPCSRCRGGCAAGRAKSPRPTTSACSSRGRRGWPTSACSSRPPCTGTTGARGAARTAGSWSSGPMAAAAAAPRRSSFRARRGKSGCAWPTTLARPTRSHSRPSRSARAPRP